MDATITFILFSPRNIIALSLFLAFENGIHDHHTLLAIAEKEGWKIRIPVF